MIPNMLQLAQTSKFQWISRFPQNFWKSFWKTGILKFWAQNQFQWPTLSGIDTQYVGIGPKQQILEIFPNFWKTGLMNFWAHNQVQWQKLRGKNTQYIEIGQNQPIPGNFQISRFPDSRFQKITDVAKSVQNYYEYVVLIVSANI